MATVTGLTAERMLEIEGSSVVDGAIVGSDLILTKHSGATINAGALPAGPQGPVGPAGGQIPGEIKMWSGDVLPDDVAFGKWVWADGEWYDTPLYPLAEANIADAWRTFAGASDPGVNKFRVPDLRGLVPAGMDQMPGGARANRLVRAVSIVLAGKTGVETHIITVPEMPPHGHPLTDPGHFHNVYGLYPTGGSEGLTGGGASNNNLQTDSKVTNITVNNTGGGGGHETMQPTVFVPYIVKLDD